MAEALGSSTPAPCPPYRGLDFYDEMHASLFRERDEEVAECIKLLSSYNVKILLLHGSSGAGKSSFLRAGLIPALKGMEGRRLTPSAQAVFLNASHGVIRCTSDPLKAIASSVLLALSNESPVIYGQRLDNGEEHALRGEPNRALHPTAAEAIEVDCDTTRLLEYSPQRALQTKLRAIEGYSHQVTGDAETAAEIAYKELAVGLVDILSDLCAAIDGKLYLILDQAEEALTRTTSTQWNNPASTGFFHFLDEAYVRNLAMRIIISVRTEYYGRFRDALRISDDRLGRRPDEGGLEPFLLRPLTKVESLVRAFSYPTALRDSNGDRVYAFDYADGVLLAVVKDVLDWKELGKAAVTPLISMACSYLYERVGGSRPIEKYDYPGIEKIIREYVSSAVKELGGPSRQSTWLELLYATLVSRQGGGTVVSLIEDSDAFYRQSQRDELGLTKTEIADSLRLLTIGSTPLLRGEPAESPVHFSLKHDAMAVRLERWHVEHKGEINRRKKSRQLQVGSLICLLVAIVVVGASIYQVRLKEAKAQALKAQSDGLKAQSDALRIQAMKNNAEADIVANNIRLRIASRANASDFALSLRLLVASQRITQGKTVSENEAVPEVDKIYATAHNDTVTSFRQTLVRAPWFSGRYRAVGFDPQGKRLAVLRRRELFVMSLTDAEQNKWSILKSDQSAVKWSTPYVLPAEWIGQTTAGSNVTVGFLHSLGPAVYVGGSLYYWKGSDHTAERIDLRNQPRIAELFNATFPPFAEFSGGSLILRKISGPTASLQVIRIDFAQSNDKEDSLAIVPASVDLPIGASYLSWSDVYDSPRFGVLGGPSTTSFLCGDTADLNESADCALTRLSGIPWYDKEKKRPFRRVKVYTGSPGGSPATPTTVGIAYAPRQSDPLQMAPPLYGYAFVSGTDKVAVIGYGGVTAIYEVKERVADSIEDRSPDIQMSIEDPSGSIDGVDDDQSLQLATPSAFWQSPLVAISAHNSGWIVAWNGMNGLWVAASSAQQPSSLTSLFKGTLLSGDPGGTLLKFTSDGSELVLIQQSRFGGPMFVRIWDVRNEWRDWILSSAGASEDYLVRLACNVLIGASNIKQTLPDESSEFRNRWLKAQVDFSQYELKLFKLDKDLNSPCYDIDQALAGGK